MARRVKTGWLWDDDMLAFFTSKLGLFTIGVALFLSVFGIQKWQLHQARADLKTAQESLATCRGSLATANASIAARAAQSASAMASAQKAQAAVAPKAAHIAAQASVLASHVIKGSDRCARWEDAEAAVRESLK